MVEEIVVVDDDEQEAGEASPAMPTNGTSATVPETSPVQQAPRPQSSSSSRPQQLPSRPTRQERLPSYSRQQQLTPSFQSVKYFIF